MDLRKQTQIWIMYVTDIIELGKKKIKALLPELHPL